MIGVVVWSSGSREKAIIWCEDQATLAYLQGTANVVNARNWPQPGDLVELETRTVGNLRHALNVSMLSEQSCSHLPRMLAESQPAVRQTPLRLVSTQEHAMPAVTEPAGETVGAEDDLYGLPRRGTAR